MIKRLLAICFLLLVFVSVRSQPYGNEWLSYSLPYYKIKVAQDGIYRISPAVLSAAGIDLSAIDPHRFQLINKGVQQTIYIEGEDDNVFSGSDFIEFYGEKNNGCLDSLLYKNTSFIPNPYYSLINDTAVYYLTWDNSVNGNRMFPENDTLFAAYGSPVNYFYKEEIHDFHDEYYAGETNNAGGTDPRYTKAEGWFDSGVITLGQTKTYTMVNTSQRYLGGPNSIIRTVAVGASKDYSLVNDHHLKITYGASNTLLTDTLFKGYAAAMFSKSISTSLLDNLSTPFEFTSISDAGFTSNRTAVSYIYVKYPHLPDMEGKTSFLFYLPDNPLNAKSYLNFNNFNASGTVHLYDLTNGKRIKVVSGSFYKTLVTNSGSEKKCYLSSDGNVINVTSVIPVTPTALFTDYSSMNADSAYLIISNKALWTSAVDYATFRSSAAGGFHNVVLADIDELYDQFAYGIVKSPLAIRGFADFMLDIHPLAPPHELFLLGKSIHINYCRQNAANYSACLVPSYGFPSSDNLLTSGLNGTILSIAIPSGRLSARTNAEVDMYRNKMQDYESLNTPEEWMKYVIHFGGGSSFGEQSTFRGYLNNYKDTIQGVNFGGRVIKEFFKNNSAPITINSSDTLRQLIDNGVAMMTFFGHASGTGFDQSIDDWSTYHPQPGRYPFLLANSCYAGDFHSPGISSSEDYIFLDHNGVIGYLGSVGLGVPFALNYFSSEFYAQLARRSYNQPVGKLIQKTIAGIQPLALAGSDSITRNTCYEMNLQGDPALKIHSFSMPDYKITNNDVYFDESDQDSLTIHAIRTNLAMAINDSMFVDVLRIFPDGDSVHYITRQPAPYFKDTITIKIPYDYTNGVGLNKIQITLDRNLEIAELDETNNSTTLVDLLINGGAIIPVYPYEFAIIPKDTVTLKASTADPLASIKTYRFQFDTTDTYNSPFKIDTLITSAGGVVKWHLPVNLSDSTVYYWRVSPDSTSPAKGFSWKESSFQYIQSKRGWEQAHFFQFKNDATQYVKFNRPFRRFDFINDVKNIYCKDGIPPAAIDYYDVIYKINGDTKYLSSWLIPHSGFTFAVLDPVGGIPVNNYATGYGNGGSFGSVTGYPAGHPPELAFEFKDDNAADQDSMTAFIMNNIPNGSYVLAYTQLDPKFGTYSSNLINAFGTLGASDLNNIPAGYPYILWGRKGIAPGTASEIVASSVDSVIVLDTTLTTNWNEGFIASPVIGPALTWDSLSWKWHSLDGPGNADSIVVRLLGVLPDGRDSVLAEFDESQLDINNLGAYVNAAQFPKIKLIAYMRDDVAHTAPQLDRWQVIYTPVPEAAINPAVGYAFANDTLQEGDNLNILLPIQNISEYPFNQDSLLVTYWIEDDARVQHPLPSRMKKKPFNPSEVLIDTISFNTMNFHEGNALWVEVNPVGQTRSQPEQYHFNNIIRIPFYINTDNINPLLDVTFDGVHILNNDIVSAKPNILIQLKDENRFLALNDTNDFKVFVKAPSSSLAQRVYFGSTMSFIPAVLPDNSCKINYTPTLNEDGIYQLLVQAKDKSDNQSGAVDYKINFEVINRSTITEVMNYPNPFSTSTRFVFTLTGSEPPSNFKIQIMTITGKVVREIYENEIGAIHIGRNITEFAWDGKDEFGDQLANGVYLYRVMTKIRGSEIEKRETAADQYFKKGWGKMYLMR